MSATLGMLSNSIGEIVVAAAPLVCAIRTGPNRHVTGLICQGGVIVTTDQGLPVAESYTVVLPKRRLAEAVAEPREPTADFAYLRLGTVVPVQSLPLTVPAVGDLVVVVGADIDGSPTSRLTVVHRIALTARGPVPILDLSGETIALGCLVLNANGCLIGLLSADSTGAAIAISGQATHGPTTTEIASGPSEPAQRRGWLGVSLQPITVPHHLVVRAGQGSGRMVVSITKGGPADAASLRIGDVLLSLNGTTTSGPQALRAFLGAERIGSTVEVRLLRDGQVLSTALTVAEQPR